MGKKLELEEILHIISIIHPDPADAGEGSCFHSSRRGGRRIMFPFIPQGREKDHASIHPAGAGRIQNSPVFCWRLKWIANEKGFDW